ncbi:SusD/RagB family nutrient-binding outer membrane lipoprotein [Chitinophaga solisilvae]|uniref:SusD/RagB family nutrient-binding outer membrane lipoprotein n=1 Tax=Chitinophaga solisilvae TaxID=1233460 RepID=UPI00136A1935|nr:SusD/RagB family nutrient-binding outer membrane lipoprotein [Chitinophaga solisilvae]
MKRWKYIAGAFIAFSLTACSNKIMDDINENLNDPKDVTAINELPSVLVETAVGTAGTDIAWYASVFIEHNVGTWGQMQDADTRVGVTSSSLGNNNWNSAYDNLMILADMIKKCSPSGTEPKNAAVLGMAQVLMAYNLAVVTDVWGQVPYSEALRGLEIPQPKYDKQQDIYKKVILPLLDQAIANFAKPVSGDIEQGLATKDLLFHGDIDLWTKSAWSLKARYNLHLINVDPASADAAAAAIEKGFASTDDGMVFRVYNSSAIGQNPWFQFAVDRNLLCAGKTLYDLMMARQDPRVSAYFTLLNGVVKPAPSGTATTGQANYSQSKFSNRKTPATSALEPTPLMTYHELKFIEAELLAKKGADFKPALKAAVVAGFEYHKLTGGEAYFDSHVLPLLGNVVADNVKEIITQKYIAFYEAESIEAYNDYRRTGYPQMQNPKNIDAAYGFVQRLPYPTSEESANSQNMPKISVFKDKIWWAGGKE